MLFNSAALAAGLLATVAIASPTPVEKRCFPSKVVIYARGTDPDATGTSMPYVSSTDSQLANIGSQGVPGATVTALSYPASGIKNTADYIPSWTDGIENLQGLIKYVVDNSCSTTKIVLLGYSQGASVVTGAVGGGQHQPPLSGKYLSAIAAGVAIADPSFVLGQNPLDSKSANTGSNGRIQDPGTPQQFVNSHKGSTWRSLCSADDYYCATGSSIQDHENAESIWSSTAINFLKSLNL